MNNEDLAVSLASGAVGVLPTDTLYGLVGSALRPEVVDRIYVLKGRDKTKPFIVLISDISDLGKFGVSIDGEAKAALEKVWPGAVSVILPCSTNLEYLHRGTGKIAFRLPDDENLRGFLKQSGPLVAPSANTEGAPPARNISEAKKYFGTLADFYIDGGVLSGAPSTVVSWSGNAFKVERQGAVSIDL